MNRFDNYVPIKFNNPQYMPDFNAFDKLLDQQDQYFQKAENEKLQTEAAADKVAASVKYFKHPLANDEQIYKNWIADQQAKKDEVTKIYQTKGVQAGRAALERYKRYLINDMQSGIGHMLNSNYEIGQQRFKEIDENKEYDQRAKEFYKYGEGAKSWISSVDGKTKLGSPNYLHYESEKDLIDRFQKAIEKVDAEQNPLQYLNAEGQNSEWVVKSIQGMPLNKVMESGFRKYIDFEKVQAALQGTLGQDALEAIRFHGLLKGQEGWDKNLMATYVFDKDGKPMKDEKGQIITLNAENKKDYPSDQYNYVYTFNKANPYGETLFNMAEGRTYNQIVKNYNNVVDTYAKDNLDFQQELKLKQIDNAQDWAKIKYKEDRADERELAKNKMVTIEGTTGDIKQISPFADKDESGNYTVNSNTFNKRKSELIKSSTNLDAIIAKEDANRDNGTPTMSEAQFRSLVEQSKELDRQKAIFAHQEEEMANLAKQKGIPNFQEINNIIEKSDWKKPMEIIIEGKSVNLSPEELVKRGYSVYKDGRVLQYIPTMRGEGTYKIVGKTTPVNASKFLTSQELYKSKKTMFDAYTSIQDEYLKSLEVHSSLNTSNTLNIPGYSPSDLEDFNQRLQKGLKSSALNDPKTLDLTFTGAEKTYKDPTIFASQLAKQNGNPNLIYVGVELDKNSSVNVTTEGFQNGFQTDFGTNPVYNFKYIDPVTKKPVEIKAKAFVPSRNSEGKVQLTSREMESYYNSPQIKAGQMQQEGMKYGIIPEIGVIHRNGKWISKSSGKQYTEDEVRKALIEYNLTK